MVEEDSLAIETTQAGLSNHDGRRRWRRLGLGFFLFFSFLLLSLAL